MQNNLNDTTNQSLFNENLRTSSSNSSIITDEIDCTTKLTCAIDGFRRKKSSSLNSPANSGRKKFIKKIIYFWLFFCELEHRPTADELERRESPWCWRSYSVSLINNH